MTNEQLVEAVLRARTPRCKISKDACVLVTEEGEQEITLDQADLLFRTMFFRDMPEGSS